MVVFHKRNVKTLMHEINSFIEEYYTLAEYENIEGDQCMGVEVERMRWESVKGGKACSRVNMRGRGKTVHLILTRFNLALGFGDKKPPASKPWLNERYLKKRFEIFEKYTFSSFLNQTNKKFVWIVMFHKDTPNIYKDRIEILKSSMPQFKAMFFDDEESGKVYEIIKEYIQSNYSNCRVITTRVDNDDAVHATFVERIQDDAALIGEKTCILSYLNGLQYDEKKRRMLKFKQPNNHFTSLIAQPACLGEHILKYNHAYIENEDVYKEYKKTQVPLWVEVVHGGNVSNELHWGFRNTFVPYSIKYEYNLSLQWDSILTYFFYLAKQIFLVFNYRV